MKIILLLCCLMGLGNPYLRAGEFEKIEIPLQFVPSADVLAIEARIHKKINQKRVTYGLPPLKLIARISNLARKHSKRMASGTVPFGHAGFNARANKLFDEGYRFVAENVGYSSDTDDPASLIVNAWMASSTHKKNILGEFNDTGVGVALNARGYCYATQLFARK